jgi:hypothetical protein
MANTITTEEQVDARPKIKGAEKVKDVPKSEAEIENEGNAEVYKLAGEVLNNGTYVLDDVKSGFNLMLTHSEVADIPEQKEKIQNFINEAMAKGQGFYNALEGGVKKISAPDAASFQVADAPVETKNTIEAHPTDNTTEKAEEDPLELIAKAVKEKEQETLTSKKPEIKVEKEDKIDEHKKGGLYDRLRKIPFLTGLADRMETETSTRKVSKLSMDLSETEGSIKRYEHEAERANSAEEKDRILKKVTGLKKRIDWLNGEKEAYEHRRNAAAEGARLLVQEKISPQVERVQQIEESIDNFRTQIDEYTQFIKDKEAERDKLKDIVSESGLGSFKTAIDKAEKSITDIKKKLGKLVIESNTLSLNVKHLEVADGIFDNLKTEDETPIQETTKETPIQDDNTGGGRLERATESAGESLSELIEGKLDLNTYVNKWNDIASRYNRINERTGEPLLPIVKGEAEEYKTVLNMVQEKLGQDVDKDNLSPEAYKQFMVMYFERNSYKNHTLDMSRVGQGNFVKALGETMRELEMEVPDELFDIDEKKAEKADKDKEKAGLADTKVEPKTTVKAEEKPKPKVKKAPSQKRIPRTNKVVELKPEPKKKPEQAKTPPYDLAA